NDIPTARFELVKNLNEETEDLRPLPFIQKLRKDGYDGRGVKRIAKAADLEEAFSEPSLIEEWIDFEQEIAVIVARNDDGETATIPKDAVKFNVEDNLV